MRIDGRTKLVAHVGHPTEPFKSPLIYNPYFESIGLNAAVVPMGIRREDGAASLRAVFRMTNVVGALVTMPLKIDVVGLLDEASTAVKVAGSCNAVRVRPDGSLLGDMFDGEGFVRGLGRKGCAIAGSRALVVGAGGVGSAISAALAGAGVGHLGLFDIDAARMDGLAGRLAAHYPALAISTGSNDPTGFSIVVNATPLGMTPGDPLPLPADRLEPAAFVGEVVMSSRTTPLLAAAQARGCRTQIGLDMLFEMIPAYLEFFGFPSTTPERLRELAEAEGPQGRSRI